ncbi:MAG TPA: alginate export family protein, partial [Candidatus Sulfotelmatobacter sp.]|nr:alginate export family protein [Candidatus Sulfotelmatobacter sp.]
MKSLIVFVSAIAFALPFSLQAQDGDQPAGEALWTAIRQGKFFTDVRYRFEGYERDGAPFTGTSYAPTLRIALGYESPGFHGFSAFAQGAGVVITGPVDYSVPTLPSQDQPDRPAILEPRGAQLSQGYLKWQNESEDHRLIVVVGRQEMALNDGRFVSISSWRQIHETFDAARADFNFNPQLAFTYAFINRYYRVVGHNATDGKPPMHSHLLNLAWRDPGRAHLSLYGLLLDYRSVAQYALSTQTFGLRAEGPYQINPTWSVLYTAEFAKQQDFGTNPNYVNANYSLTELGPGWRGFGLKAGFAFLQGRSSTNEITTPLANPFNG